MPHTDTNISRDALHSYGMQPERRLSGERRNAVKKGSGSSGEIRIYSDEYGIYLTTSKGWYNGEHGIFIAKDEEKMPPDINWGLIEGRIYTYAIYD